MVARCRVVFGAMAGEVAEWGCTWRRVWKEEVHIGERRLGWGVEVTVMHMHLHCSRLVTSASWTRLSAVIIALVYEVYTSLSDVLEPYAPAASSALRDCGYARCGDNAHRCPSRACSSDLACARKLRVIETL